MRRICSWDSSRRRRRMIELCLCFTAERFCFVAPRLDLGFQLHRPKNRVILGIDPRPIPSVAVMPPVLSKRCKGAPADLAGMVTSDTAPGSATR